ncbi:MAG: ACT domain-containing protein [Rhodocyclaceae bacterium]|nr:ACT domain-containing protein [Rhodocyclaceae bacterium]
MNASLVITLVGTDRPGLVNALAARAAECGANWLESSMAQLAGKFAGVVRLSVAENDVGKLEAALRALEGDDLRLTIERGAMAAAAGRTTRLELLGQDRPGIVREISAVLARHGASIEKLDTCCENASFSGEPLFRAEIAVQVPAGLEPASLKADLEALANELMVDLTLEGDTEN